jgi:hypothetical protein
MDGYEMKQLAITRSPRGRYHGWHAGRADLLSFAASLPGAWHGGRPSPLGSS